MLTTTNQRFCYWLQGYFEIGQDVMLSTRHIALINQQLCTIQEPLGSFTGWLKKVGEYIAERDNTDAACEFFAPKIELALNSVFFHVIDNTYETDTPKEVLLRIHDGGIPRDQ
ncbi:MAG: hypothetical protein DHS20C10_01400 [marine bacterium B5-7]|nr:MAG: hypothetical protein DHS20C10_01400 [marine bacterium B5-7]